MPDSNEERVNGLVDNAVPTSDNTKAAVLWLAKQTEQLHEAMASALLYAVYAAMLGGKEPDLARYIGEWCARENAILQFEHADVKGLKQ